MDDKSIVLGLNKEELRRRMAICNAVIDNFVPNIMRSPDGSVDMEAIKKLKKRLKEEK